MLEFAGIFDAVHKIVIQLNATIYKFVGWLYQLYIVIASARILKSDAIESLTKRMMVIVGVVALFITAFSLIKALIDPDKEIKNTSKIFVNIITSIIMLTLVNTVFNYLYEGQSLLLKQNVIGKIIIGGYNDKGSDISISNAGNVIAADTLGAFFTKNEGLTGLDAEDFACRDSEGNKLKVQDLIDRIDPEDDSEENEKDNECYYEAPLTTGWKAFKKGFFKGFLLLPTDPIYQTIGGIVGGAKEMIDSGKQAKLYTYEDILNLAVVDTSYFLYLAPGISSGVIEFSWLLAIICGFYLIYIFVSFCLDMAVRCAKLAALQIISPVAIMSRIIPGQESIFNNWLKKTLTSFLEVFIKLAIIFFGVFLILQVHNVSLSNIIDADGASFGVQTFGRIAIILGILMFVKQAPGFISQIFGIDSGNMKLGIKDKLSAAGVFAGGAALGAGTTALVRNAREGYANGRNNGKNKGLSMLSGLKSGIAGGGSGFVRGLRRGKDGKNWNDMKNAATAGAEAATNKRDKRRVYKENHGGSFAGAMKGHFDDAIQSINDWSTGTKGGILGKTAFEEEFKNSYSDLAEIYENKDYQAMKTQLNQYEALKASGVKTYEGTDVESAIKTLKGNMLKERMKAYRKSEQNTQSAAYAVYNIAQMAKKNSKYAKDIGLKVSKADDLVLKDKQIYDKTTGELITADKLTSIIEGSSLDGVKYDKDKGFELGGKPLDFTVTAEKQTKDGISHQKKIASDALRADKMSIEYKEAIKQQNDKK